MPSNGDDDVSWTPPACPDPSLILREAVDDARNGNYALALVKHSWYYNNALKHEPAQYGVRLSFALGYWHELAMAYPPAMDELRSLREIATRNAIAGIEIHDSFHDAKALNRVLGDPTATRDLFLELHKSNPAEAKKVYRLAQPVLIRFGEYEVCHQYLDADIAVERIIERYPFHGDGSTAESASESYLEYAEKKFKNEAATVIALLVVAGRLDRAQEIANRILVVKDDESVRQIVDRALTGEFPPQRE